VEVVRSESPRPALALTGAALALAGSRRIDVSLSHIPTYAVAVVLVED
jgi:phosphopantetheinyl transferase (holo-ACP synthase)